MNARISSDQERTNDHLVDSYTLLIVLSNPSVESVVYVKADSRLMIVALNQSFDKCVLYYSKVLWILWTKRFYHRIIPNKDTDRIANSEDPD